MIVHIKSKSKEQQESLASVKNLQKAGDTRSFYDQLRRKSPKVDKGLVNYIHKLQNKRHVLYERCHFLVHEITHGVKISGVEFRAIHRDKH
jgi:hypothetical protein